MSRPASAPDPAARRRPLPVLFAAVAALAVGLGAGWLLPSPLEGGADPASPAALRDQACGLAGASFADGVDETIDIVGAEANELFAISGLLPAAAAKDDAYERQGEVGLGLLTAVQRFDVGTMQTLIAELNEDCGA